MELNGVGYCSVMLYITISGLFWGGAVSIISIFSTLAYESENTASLPCTVTGETDFGVKYHALVNTLISWQISKSNMVNHQTDQANMNMSPLLTERPFI